MSLKTSGKMPLPKPSFDCAAEDPESDIGYYAEELTYWEGDEENDPGWYCEYCLEAAGADINADCGPPLSECIVVRDVREKRQNES